ncbi:solute carrier family 35 member B1 [Aplysia californica]|uniref:Solute carrier family 35 member B1 n=1 Tax=Aplysia californica TaxID=6500 RepID=A0ABM1A8B5_APLCA|nr:solute carrier family 35 member B1 [Aplysia californica]
MEENKSGEGTDVEAAVSAHAEVAERKEAEKTSETAGQGIIMGEPSTKKLVVCAAGIFICYFYYGVLQEKITKGEYGEGEKQEKFHFTLCLVMVQCIINAAYAKIAMSFFPKERDSTNKGLYAACAFTYLGAMLASNHALQHVTYPTQVLGKSIKPIPVMILGVLFAAKRYPLAKYLCVLLIVMGVGLFMYKEKRSSPQPEDHHILGTGEVLLLVSLTLDGLTGASQDRMRSQYKTGANNMMFFVNLCSVIYLSIGVVITGELFEFVAFANRYPYVLFNMISFSLASAVGQMFIFITVTTFGPLTCSIVTTTRKFFTILGSVIIFQNPMSGRQWLGTSLVFVGLGLDSVYGKEKKKGR